MYSDNSANYDGTVDAFKNTRNAREEPDCGGVICINASINNFSLGTLASSIFTGTLLLPESFHTN